MVGESSISSRTHLTLEREICLPYISYIFAFIVKAAANEAITLRAVPFMKPSN